MGLLYQMPVTESEGDRTLVKDNAITLKSYGLPYIFWGYLLASLTVVAMMYLAIKGPALKLIATKDSINQLLGYGVLATLAIIPIGLITFFFYEKKIVKKENRISIIHSLFFNILKFEFKYDLKEKDSFTIKHHLDSPNVARIQGKVDMKAFENRGYHQLFAVNNKDKLVLIDRNSRLGDLKKIAALLSKF